MNEEVSDDINNFNNLNFEYNKKLIELNSINSFYDNVSRRDNDQMNKTRENVIGAIINRKVPEKYYEISSKWLDIKKFLEVWIKKFKESNNILDDNNFNIKLKHKGGRSNSHDFEIITNNKVYKIEFKYNSKEIKSVVQFSSPYKPSQYMSSSYEEFFYDNYLQQIASKFNLPFPNRTDYLKQVLQTKPKCMEEYCNLYFKGSTTSSRFEPDNLVAKEFNNICNYYDKTSRVNFIETNELNIELLSTYLVNQQNNKIYMLYQDNVFYYETTKTDDYKIVSVQKYPIKYKFVTTSLNGVKLDILLRWKNGNGVAQPAFQISYSKN